MNNDRPEAGTAGSKVDAEEVANARLVPQLEMMARALLAAPVRNTLFMLSGSIFFVIAATAYGQIRLNSWNQPFYDALSHRNFTEFLYQLGIFGLIAGIILGSLALNLSGWAQDAAAQSAAAVTSATATGSAAASQR